MSVADDHDLTPDEVSRVISMAWEDDVPFAAIEQQFGLDEEAVIDLMRQELKPSSWRLWRERVQNRPTKHAGKDTLSGSTSRRPPTGRPPDAPNALDLPPDAR